MVLNPPTQYADDANLRARQRVWDFQVEPFDICAWVIDLAGPTPGDHVLDVGCGNGRYLWAMQEHAIDAFGCDLSPGMLRAVGPHPRLVNADVTALALRDGCCDIVLAPHMLYHVSDRQTAARELRRVLHPGGVCVAVTNGDGHMRSIRTLVERCADTPGWTMLTPNARAFSLENGASQLEVAFDSVRRIVADVAPATVTDASVIAGYVASMRDHYEHEVDRPWDDVVAEAAARAAEVIDRSGAFVVENGVGAFVCS